MGEGQGRPLGKGAWAGRAGQQLSIPEMKESVQERSGWVDIGGQLRQVEENAKHENHIIINAEAKARGPCKVSQVEPESMYITHPA